MDIKEQLNGFNSHVNGESFLWCVQYNDSIQPEFIGDTRYTFKDIRKNEMKNFLLYGQGIHVSIDNNNGIIDLFSNKLEIRLYDKKTDKEIAICNRLDERYDSVIMYRQCQDVLRPNNDGSNAQIIGYTVGYKKELDDMFHKIEFNIPYGKSVNLTYRCVSPIELDGEVRLYINGNLTTHNTCVMEPNKAYSCQFILK